MPRHDNASLCELMMRARAPTSRERLPHRIGANSLPERLPGRLPPPKAGSAPVRRPTVNREPLQEPG